MGSGERSSSRKASELPRPFCSLKVLNSAVKNSPVGVGLGGSVGSATGRLERKEVPSREPLRTAGSWPPHHGKFGQRVYSKHLEASRILFLCTTKAKKKPSTACGRVMRTPFSQHSRLSKAQDSVFQQPNLDSEDQDPTSTRPTTPSSRSLLQLRHTDPLLEPGTCTPAMAPGAHLTQSCQSRNRLYELYLPFQNCRVQKSQLHSSIGWPEQNPNLFPS